MGLTTRILRNIGINKYGDDRFLIRRSSETTDTRGMLRELWYMLTCRQYHLCEQGKIDFDNTIAVHCKRKRCPVKTWRLITRG